MIHSTSARLPYINKGSAGLGDPVERRSARSGTIVNFARPGGGDGGEPPYAGLRGGDQSLCRRSHRGDWVYIGLADQCREEELA